MEMWLVYLIASATTATLAGVFRVIVLCLQINARRDLEKMDHDLLGDVYQQGDATDMREAGIALERVARARGAMPGTSGGRRLLRIRRKANDDEGPPAAHLIDAPRPSGPI